MISPAGSVCGRVWVQFTDVPLQLTETSIKGVLTVPGPYFHLTEGALLKPGQLLVPLKFEHVQKAQRKRVHLQIKARMGLGGGSDNNTVGVAVHVHMYVRFFTAYTRKGSNSTEYASPIFQLFETGAGQCLRSHFHVLVIYSASTRWREDAGLACTP